VPVGINDYPNAIWNGYSTNASDICVRLGSLRPNANRVGLGRYTNVTNIDVVAAIGEILPASKPSAILLLPLILVKSALTPVAVLLFPFRL